MRVIYHTMITQIGHFAEDALQDDMLITFKEGAPADLADFCFIHRVKQSAGDLQVGDQLQINDHHYVISALGSVASLNLRELGHVTLRFDSAKVAELPGNVHLVGATPEKLPLGSILTFTRC